MRKRRLLLTASASLATVVLTMGTALADPVPLPPPYPPVVIVGAQVIQELFDVVCNQNTNFRNPMGSANPNDRICQSFDVEPQPILITTRDPLVPPEYMGQSLLGSFGSGNRTQLFKLLGIADSANYTDPDRPGECITDKDSNGVGITANDGRVLANAKQRITYSAGQWLAQVFNAVPDIHGASILGRSTRSVPEF